MPRQALQHQEPTARPESPRLRTVSISSSVLPRPKAEPVGPARRPETAATELTAGARGPAWRLGRKQIAAAMPEPVVPVAAAAWEAFQNPAGAKARAEAKARTSLVKAEA